MAKTLKQELEGLRLEETWGEFQSWADDNTRAVVIDTQVQKVIRTFRGESAWMSANRFACDLYLAVKERAGRTK